MVHRTRTRTTMYHGGVFRRRYNPSHPWETTSVLVGERDACHDHLHPYPYVGEDGFYQFHLTHNPCRVNASWGTYPNWVYEYNDAPVANDRNNFFTSWNYQRLENAALAHIYDTQPIVDLPLSIAELKDIPRLMKDVAAKGVRLAGSPEGYLNFQWALRPMLGDMLSMISLQKQIAQRIKSHRRKFRTERASGRGPMVTYVSAVGNDPVPMALPGGFSVNLSYSSPQLIRGESWYSARITPEVELPELLAEAADYRHATGRGRSGLTVAYNLLPWSWLIDYFTSLGDVLELRENRVPYKVHSMCLMSETEYRLPYKVIPGGSQVIKAADCTPGWTTIVEKRRRLVLYPEGKLYIEPLLSGQQLTNLAALAAVLSKRASQLR